jgi:phosphoglycolate phosphatase-like HAD superfamily hydrolase
MDYQLILKELRPSHEFFIGIDSDGCVFDTMEIKQKEFFIPSAIKYFDLFAVSKIVRETWEFVNLYSIFRGGNRFTSLIKVFELLAERAEIIDSGFRLPDLSSLKKWVAIETKLGNASLRRYFESAYDPDLEKVVKWSELVNRDISEWLHDIPPFPNSKAAIKKMSSFADIIVVSQTPLEALEREWNEHDLTKFIRVIAAQEHGTKAEHLALAAKGKYPDNKILMIGDAIGDLIAARNNGVHFYPIIPGREGDSWKNFLHEGIDRFKSGSFSGKFQDDLLTEFANVLPETPPWKK